MSTAAVVIIGNEILSGKFADENAPYFVKRLREVGVDLRRISTISDEIDGIAEEVARLSARYDHVFTTGGVGPTHDDLTFLGVAAAFGLALEVHPELEAILRARMPEPVNGAALRMAEIPVGSELWRDGEMIWPVVVVRNVVVLPGVPSLVRRKFEAIAHRFQGVPVQLRTLRTLATEPEIADALTEAAARWPAVAIGSYPRLDDTPRCVIVTMESRDADALDACATHLAPLILPRSAASTP